MAKFDELTNEEALDRLADMIGPLAVIFSDDKVTAAAQKSRIHGIQYALKNHPHEVISVLAVYQGVPVEQFKRSGVAIIGQIIEIMSNPELQAVFPSQEQKEEK